MNLYGYVFIGFKKMGELRKYGTTFETLRIQNYLAALGTEETVVEIFAEKMTNRDNDMHLRYVQNIVGIVRDGVLVINNLEDFSSDENEVAELYKMCWKNNVDLQILDTPWLNIGFLKQYHISQSGAVAMIKVMYKRNRYKIAELKTVSNILNECPVVSNDHNKGRKLETKKSNNCKAIMIEQSMYFNGRMSDPDLIEYLGISKNTYYKYKKELREELKKIKIKENTK